MPKIKPQKPLNTGKIQIIHGVHAVRAATMNTAVEQRVFDDLITPSWKKEARFSPHLLRPLLQLSTPQLVYRH